MITNLGCRTRLTSSKLQVFVSGTWREDLAAEYAEAAAAIGVLIAQAGFSLACGPGTGTARYAIDGFRSVKGRSGIVRYYLPGQQHMVAAGEEIQPGADEIVQTDLDYPMRNVHQVSQSSGLIAVTGGEGTLEEILPAVIDYHLPVAVLKGSGPAAAGLEMLLGLFPDWELNVLIGDDPDALAQFVFERMLRA